MKTSATKVDLALLAATLLDIVAWQPGLRPSLETDFIRVKRLFGSRGLPILMIDFPSAGKVLDLALSRGVIVPENLPKVFGKIDGPSRTLFGCLFQGIFNSDCTIKDGDDTIQYVFFLRQILLMFKKVVEPCSPDDVEKAIVEYTSIEWSMRKPTNEWAADHVKWSATCTFSDGYVQRGSMFGDEPYISPKLVELAQLVCDRIVSLMPPVDYRDLQPRHGPGAVADARSGTDKYLFPNWSDKLDGFFPYTYFAQHREDLHLEEDFVRQNREPPARLIPVPKTLDKPRIIASEPVAHQYCQQSLMCWLRDNLSPILSPYINFLNQMPSRELALESSLTGDLATVDLSSASDRLSCWVVERAMRRNSSLLSALHSARSRWMHIKHPVGNYSEFLLLRKFASQGSATTFPVQSIIYTCLAIAAVLFEDGCKNPTTEKMLAYKNRLRVFGDDIIIPSRAVRNLVDLLSFMGLKVNMGKTHYTGHFRESCGMDAFHGSAVMPTYLRYLSLDITAETLTSWIDVSNNAYHNGLWNLSDYMISCVPPKVRKLIILSKTPVSAISLSTFQESPPVSRTRWNKSHHVYETPALQRVGKTVQGERSTSMNLLQYFVENPATDNYGRLAYLSEKNWKAGFKKATSSKLRKTWVQSTRKSD